MYWSWTKLPGSSFRELERFVTDRKRAGTCLQIPAATYCLDVEISSTQRRGSGTVELNGGWKIFYTGVDAAMSDQAGVGLLVSRNMAKCVFGWVPLGGRVCLLKLRLQERSLCILQV